MPKDLFNEANDALDKALDTERRNKRFIETVGPAVANSLRGVLADLLQAIGQIPGQVKQGVEGAKIKTDIKIPDINMPAVQLPELTLPTMKAPKIVFPEQKAPIVKVNVPDVVVPEIKVPKPEVTVNVPALKTPIVNLNNNALIKEIRSVVKAVSSQEVVFPEPTSIFDEVGFSKPLPVILTDAKGKPVVQYQSGGGSGHNANVQVEELFGTVGASMTNADNRLRVSLETGGSGLTDSELRATSVPIKQVSGLVDSVNVVDAYGSTSVGSVFNADNRMRVSLETGGSGLTDNELRAAGVPVAQVSGATWSTKVIGTVPVSAGASLEVKQVSGLTDSVNVVDAFGSTAVSSVWNADNRLKVSVETGGSGLTDNELRAAGVPVSQVSGANWSTEVTGFSGSVSAMQMDADGNYRGTIPVETDQSFEVKQVSGFIDSVNVVTTVGLTDTELRASNVPVSQVSGLMDSVSVKEIWGSTITTLLNGDNRIPASLETGGSGLTDNELRAAHLDVKQLSGFTSSVNVLDAFGSTSVSSVFNADNRLRVSLETGGSGLTDNELRASHIDVKQVSGSVDSVVVNSGTITAVTDITNSISVQQVDADNVYRDVFPTNQVTVRDLTTTAYVSLSTGTEATLLAGTASTFYDLVYIMGANQSDAAVTVDVRSGTAGSVVCSLTIPAEATQGVSLSRPIPMIEQHQAWTVDMPDITGTTVDISALFDKV